MSRYVHRRRRRASSYSASPLGPTDSVHDSADCAVEPDRIEVRFRGPQEAVGWLFALAQALANDYDASDYQRFEALVGGGREAAGGGEEVTG